MTSIRIAVLSALAVSAVLVGGVQASHPAAGTGHAAKASTHLIAGPIICCDSANVPV